MPVGAALRGMFPITEVVDCLEQWRGMAVIQAERTETIAERASLRVEERLQTFARRVTNQV